MNYSGEIKKPKPNQRLAKLLENEEKHMKPALPAPDKFFTNSTTALSVGQERFCFYTKTRGGKMTTRYEELFVALFNGRDVWEKYEVEAGKIAGSIRDSFIEIFEAPKEAIEMIRPSENEENEFVSCIELDDEGFLTTKIRLYINDSGLKGSLPEYKSLYLLKMKKNFETGIWQIHLNAEKFEAQNEVDVKENSRFIIEKEYNRILSILGNLPKYLTSKKSHLIGFSFYSIFVITLVVLFFASCASMTQMRPEMREVVTVENHELFQNEAFDLTMRWIATTFNSANDVIQLADKENGTIVVKGVYYISRVGITSYPLSYTMIIDIKDKKTRFTQIVGSPLDPKIGGISQADAEKIHLHFSDLRSSLLAYYKKGHDF